MMMSLYKANQKAKALRLLTNDNIAISVYSRLAELKKKEGIQNEIFLQKIEKYQSQGIIQDDDDYGLKVGAPPILSNSLIPKLNDNLKDYKVYAKKMMSQGKTKIADFCFNLIMHTHKQT